MEKHKAIAHELFEFLKASSEELPECPCRCLILTLRASKIHLNIYTLLELDIAFKPI